VPVEPDLFFNACVQAFAIAHRQLEDALIGSQDEDVPRGIQDGGADLAVLEMLLHEFARFGREGVVEKFGDAIPDVLGGHPAKLGNNVALRAARETVHDRYDPMGVLADLVSRNRVADVGLLLKHKFTLGAFDRDREVTPGTGRNLATVPVAPVVKMGAGVKWHEKPSELEPSVTLI